MILQTPPVRILPPALLGATAAHLLFSVNSSRVLSPLLEGYVVAINASDDYYFCTLLIDPLGKCELNFFGTPHLPSVGDSFLVSLVDWVSGVRVSNLVWPVKPLPSRARHLDRYYRFLTLRKLGGYSVACFFTRTRYFVKPSSFVFPIKKGQFCYPSFSKQLLFLPRNLHRSLLRSGVGGFSVFFHFLYPLVFSSLSWMLHVEGLVLPTSAVSAMFSTSTAFHLVDLFRLTPSCTIRRLRKRARNALSRSLFAVQTARLSTSFAAALSPFSFFLSFLLIAPPRSLFMAFLQSALLHDFESPANLYSPLFYYKGLVYKFGEVAPWLGNSRRYSPLVSTPPTRRKPRRAQLLRKNV
jgi:hypothetical protein